MAWDYYLKAEDSLEKVEIPEWFNTIQLKEEECPWGEINRFGVFTRSEVMTALNQFKPPHATAESLHQGGLDYLTRSKADRFKVTSIYWTSGMD